MVESSGSRVVLIGGGLGGALLATYLGRAGYQVELFERRPDPGQGNYVGGRSINLALSTRGIHALSQVGLHMEVLSSAIPMRGRMIHARDGSLHFQPYDKDPQRCIYSIGRAALNSTTIAAARALPNVRVHFDHRCVDVDLDRPAAKLVRLDGETLEVEGDLLIGVDGAFSTVRRAMQRLDRFNYRQDYLEHGYKELTIPPREDGGFRMEPNALHIWPRSSFMMIALPNPDASFTCTLFYPFDGPASFATLQTVDDVRDFFRREFPDAVPMMPTLVEDFYNHPTGSMMTVRCDPWHFRGKVALLGDAAHAVVPFYGQGMNASFEDVVVIDECLKRYPADRCLALAEYGAIRKPHADALANLALLNFIEMRDKTRSRSFRLYKAMDRTLHRLLPGLYTPLYTLVSFTRTPYADAVRQARRQDLTVAASAVVLAVLLLGTLLTLTRAAGAAASFALAAAFVYVAVNALRVRRRMLNRRVRLPAGLTH